MKKIKITPFIIIILILLYLSIWKYHLLNFWTLRGGESLIGIFALGFIGLAIILFIIDKILIKKLHLKKVIFIELGIIISISLIGAYNSKKLICNLNKDVDYFAIVYNVENATELSTSFPFNKKIRIRENGAYLTKTPKIFNNMPIIEGRDYNVISSYPFKDTIGTKIYKYEIITINKVPDTVVKEFKIKIHDTLVKVCVCPESKM